MSSMGKGEIWVNGKSIGRHWPVYIARGSCGATNVVPVELWKVQQTFLVMDMQGKMESLLVRGFWLWRIDCQSRLFEKGEDSWSLEISVGGLVSALLDVKEFEERWIGWAGVNVPDEVGQKTLTEALAEKVTKLFDLWGDDCVCSVGWAQRGTHLAVGTKNEIDFVDFFNNHPKLLKFDIHGAMFDALFQKNSLKHIMKLIMDEGKNISFGNEFVLTKSMCRDFVAKMGAKSNGPLVFLDSSPTEMDSLILDDAMRMSL